MNLVNFSEGFPTPLDLVMRPEGDRAFLLVSLGPMGMTFTFNDSSSPIVESLMRARSSNAFFVTQPHDVEVPGQVTELDDTRQVEI